MKVIDRIKGGFDLATGKKERDRQFDELRAICMEYEQNTEKLTKKAQSLYDKRKNYVMVLLSVESQMSTISNVPKWCIEEIRESIELTKDFQLAVKYENAPQEFAELNDKSGRTAAFMATGGAVGAATAAFGSTAAMSLATVLGTASTGTAISALSGAAATNAALAWLGGGALAAGGAGVAGGNLLLAMFGPIGAAIAGISGAVGIAVIRKRNSKQTILVQEQKENIKADNRSLSQRINELQALINRSSSFAKDKLKPSAQWLKEVEPKDYKKWTKEQKHELEVLVNNVSNMAQLINQRV